MTKIFSRLDEVLKDYRFTSEVTDMSRRLKDQWARYCFVWRIASSLNGHTLGPDER